MNKKTVFIALISLFFIINMFLLRSNLALKRLMKQEEAEFEQRLKSESKSLRSEVKKDLEEKYRADIVSYQAMAKKVELEKRKIRELEEELEKLKRLGRK